MILAGFLSSFEGESCCTRVALCTGHCSAVSLWRSKLDSTWTAVLELVFSLFCDHTSTTELTALMKMIPFRQRFYSWWVVLMFVFVMFDHPVCAFLVCFLFRSLFKLILYALASLDWKVSRNGFSNVSVLCLGFFFVFILLFSLSFWRHRNYVWLGAFHEACLLCRCRDSWIVDQYLHPENKSFLACFGFWYFVARANWHCFSRSFRNFQFQFVVA